MNLREQATESFYRENGYIPQKYELQEYLYENYPISEGVRRKN
jgi:hypothetical protein